MSKRIGSYKLGRTLGVGSFSKVKFGVHEPTGKRVAIKVLNKHQLKKMEMEHKVYREIEILARLNHPHVIRLYEMIETSTDIYVVMEYVPRGELFDFIVTNGRLNEQQARRFFQQIIAGIQYCHAKDIVHRDLKPENLLLDDDYNLRIADFGLSNTIRDGYFLKTSCGSPNYAAPEVICDHLYAGPEVDVWSCGVILYALLCGSLPFDDENIPNLFRKIKTSDYVLPTFLPDGARNLIKKMLCVNPMKRITIAEIRQDEWFNYALPKYLQVDPFRTIELEKKTNTRIVELCSRMGYSREDIEGAMKKGYKLLTHPKYRDKKWSRLREAAVCYHLHFDKHYRIKFAKDIQKSIDSEKWVNMNSLDIRTPDEQQKNYVENARDQLRRQHQAQEINEVERTFEDKNYSVKWQVGFATDKTPLQFMRCVFDKLKKINMEWKLETPYCILARTIMPEEYYTMEDDKKRQRKQHLKVKNRDNLTAPSDSELMDSSGAIETNHRNKEISDDERGILDNTVGSDTEIPLPTTSRSPNPQQNNGIEDQNAETNSMSGDRGAEATLTNEDSASSASLTELVETPLRLIAKQESSETQGGISSADLSQSPLPVSLELLQNSGKEPDMPDLVEIKLQLYSSKFPPNPSHRITHGLTSHAQGFDSASASEEPIHSYDQYFLLDIQKIQGDTFPFLDVCCKVMTALRGCRLTHM